MRSTGVIWIPGCSVLRSWETEESVVRERDAIQKHQYSVFLLLECGPVKEFLSIESGCSRSKSLTYIKDEEHASGKGRGKTQRMPGKEKRKAVKGR